MIKNIEQIDNLDKAKKIISMFIFAIGLIIVLTYICVFERSEVNNDYTDTLLWAYESIVGKGLYNKDFCYAYMLPFGGSLIMLPFAMLLGFSYPAHIMGMSVFAVLYAILLFFFFENLFENSNIGLILSGLIMMLLTCSKALRLIFWGHVIQYSLGIAMLLLGLLIVKKIYDGYDVFYFGLFMWTCLCMTNGINIVPFFFAPLLAGIILERFFDEKSSFSDCETIKALKMSFVMIISGVIGYEINVISQKELDKTYLSTLFSFRQTDEWFYSLNSWLSTWCSLGSDKVNSGDKIICINGISVCGLVIFCFAVLILPIVACFFYKKIENRLVKMLIISHHVIFVFSLLMLSVIYTANFNWRWGGAFASGIIVSITFSVWMLKQDGMKRYGCALLIFFGVCAILSAGRVLKLDATKGANVYDRVIEKLNEEHQIYGYGIVWDANAITLLSNSKIKMRSIAFEDWNEGRYVIDWYQCEKGWYDDQEDVSEYFVYLDEEHFEDCSEHLKAAAKKTVEIEDGDAYIMIFDGNIFKDGQGIYNPIE